MDTRILSGFYHLKPDFDLHGVEVKNESGEFYMLLRSMSMDRFNFGSFIF
jgi:hypothetical protein